MKHIETSWLTTVLHSAVLSVVLVVDHLKMQIAKYALGPTTWAIQNCLATIFPPYAPYSTSAVERHLSDSGRALACAPTSSRGPQQMNCSSPCVGTPSLQEYGRVAQCTKTKSSGFCWQARCQQSGEKLCLGTLAKKPQIYNSRTPRA